MDIKRTVTSSSFWRGVGSVFDIGALRRDYLVILPKRMHKRRARLPQTDVSIRATLYLTAPRSSTKPVHTPTGR